MKNNRISLFILLTSILFLGIAFYFKYVNQHEPYRFLEYFNLQSNHLNVKLDFQKLEMSKLKVKWVGKKERRILLKDRIRKDFYDTVLLFSYNKKIAEIPDRYGPTKIIVEYKDVIFDKIGIWKYKEWYKHNYHLNLKYRAPFLYVDWCIYNLYSKEAGNDSIRLE